MISVCPHSQRCGMYVIDCLRFCPPKFWRGAPYAFMCMCMISIASKFTISPIHNVKIVCCVCIWCVGVCKRAKRATVWLDSTASRPVIPVKRLIKTCHFMAIKIGSSSVDKSQVVAGPEFLQEHGGHCLRVMFDSKEDEITVKSEWKNLLANSGRWLSNSVENACIVYKRRPPTAIYSWLGR